MRGGASRVTLQALDEVIPIAAGGEGEPHGLQGAVDGCVHFGSAQPGTSIPHLQKPLHGSAHACVIHEPTAAAGRWLRRGHRGRGDAAAAHLDQILGAREAAGTGFGIEATGGAARNGRRVVDLARVGSTLAVQTHTLGARFGDRRLFLLCHGAMDTIRNALRTDAPHHRSQSATRYEREATR